MSPSLRLALLLALLGTAVGASRRGAWQTAAGSRGAARVNHPPCSRRSAAARDGGDFPHDTDTDPFQRVPRMYSAARWLVLQRQASGIVRIRPL